ncbi:MAG: oligosaccharide flippase family protein [Ruminococcus sp.]|jgi:stage V sporulation protein B|nr:oligosaccharide flippase family protein [Ruminococcus sp.]
MKKQTFIQASAILILSVILTKVIGAVFRIPLANMLGGTGMGYYSIAYGLFTLILAFSSIGLPAAVAKVVSESAALGADPRRIGKISLILFGSLGAFFAALSLPLSLLFCNILSDSPKALPAVLMIIPSVIFCAVESVLRGYFEGLRDFTPTGISQVIEAAGKLIFGLWFCNLALSGQFFDFGIENGYDLYANAAAAAIFGVTVSSFLGMCFLIIRYAAPRKESVSMSIHITKSAEDLLYQKQNLICKNSLSKNVLSDKKTIIKALLAAAIPISLGALVTNLTSLADIATAVPLLGRAIADSGGRFDYIGLAPAETSAFIFGSFTGLAVTVFNLVPSFTNMFAKSILPPLAESFALGDTEGIKKHSENVIFTTALISIPAGIGIAAIAELILKFLFPARLLEVSVIIPSMGVLGIALIFTCISTSAFSILQAAGRADIPVKIVGAGVILKVLGNFLLIPIPELNITGAAVSTFLCYLFIVVVSLEAVFSVTKLKRKTIGAILFRVSFCGIFCGISALLMKNAASSYELLPQIFMSISAGGVMFLITGFLTGVLSKDVLKKMFE